VLDVLPESPSWDETAALIENLDLVITVDTGVAHLAGAMGKPTWVVMQQDGASWHFMCEREGAAWNEASPWYPSIRIFRQPKPYDWNGAIAKVVKALAV
jgi:ADP-heptose:LPS heptosyltransferase